MKYLIFITMFFASAARADSEIVKNLSAHPVRFVTAFDTADSNGQSQKLYLLSIKDEIRGYAGCNSDPGSGFSTYLNIIVYNRWGIKIGEGYMYTDSSADCYNLLPALFDNPQDFEFTFGPLNRWKNRVITMKKVAAPK